MDGRGRALDNIFVERLWRSVKYECVYLRQFDTVNQARAGLKDYFEFYNYERLHQSLDHHTPAQVYLDNNSSVNTVLYQPNSILILWLFGLDIGEYLKYLIMEACLLSRIN